VKSDLKLQKLMVTHVGHMSRHCGSVFERKMKASGRVEHIFLGRMEDNHELIGHGIKLRPDIGV
jgi:hypothetical protein